MEEKGRVRSTPQSAKRGDRNTCPTGHHDTDSGPIRATFLPARLATCSGAARWRDPRSGKEDRLLRTASDGFGSSQAAPSPPPGIELREVVEHGGEPRPVGASRGSVCPRRRASGRVADPLPPDRELKAPKSSFLAYAITIWKICGGPSLRHASLASWTLRGMRG